MGARTRRGLGAVKVTGSNLNPVSQQEVKSKHGVMVLHNSGNTAIHAWRYAIDKLKDFRQGMGERYPRAAFGLPIVFQNDPTGKLEPAIGDGDRMASPLILRPYFDGTTVSFSRPVAARLGKVL